MKDDVPVTAEDLVRELMNAGANEARARRWVWSKTPLLSGLRPGDAISGPATADRARTALRRYIARMPEPIPDGVRVTAVRVLRPGTYLVELAFAWPGGTAVR